MERYLRPIDTESCNVSAKTKRKGQQQRLSECKKVVKLKASRYSICQYELKNIRAALEDSESTVETLQHYLRHLDSLILHTDALVESQVGRSVKALRKHEDASVGALARKLVQKWRSIVQRESKKVVGAKRFSENIGNLLPDKPGPQLLPNLLHCWFADHHVIKLPQGHRFPRSKHRAIRDQLSSESQTQQMIRFHASPLANKLDLMRVHARHYIDSFESGCISDTDMRRIGFPWNSSIVGRHFAATGGSVAAVKALLEQPDLRITAQLAGVLSTHSPAAVNAQVANASSKCVRVSSPGSPLSAPTQLELPAEAQVASEMAFLSLSFRHFSTAFVPD